MPKLSPEDLAATKVLIQLHGKARRAGLAEVVAFLGSEIDERQLQCPHHTIRVRRSRDEHGNVRHDGAAFELCTTCVKKVRDVTIPAGNYFLSGDPSDVRRTYDENPKPAGGIPRNGNGRGREPWRARAFSNSGSYPLTVKGS